MSLFVIGDLHLSQSADKPMDIFGPDWAGHVSRLSDGFELAGVLPDDAVVLLGDLSWGLGFGEAESDFRFIDALPGRKFVVKGNHDLWWSTVSKMERRIAEIGLAPVGFLHNSAFEAGGFILCGTRGWFYEEERGGAHDQKMLAREICRLRASFERGAALKRDALERTGRDIEMLCFLHYPPLYEGYRCDGIVDMINEFGVKRCYYAHLHGYGRKRAIEGPYKGIEYTLVSADHLEFKPIKVLTRVI